MHPRISVSAISTSSWDLQEDMAFYAQAGIDHIGVSLLKLERHGLQDGARKVAATGLRVSNLLARGPFTLAQRDGWEPQRRRALAGLDAAVTMGAECMVLTTGPDSRGHYHFDNFTGIDGMGTYNVCLVVPSGFTQTSANPATIQNLTLTNGNGSGVDEVDSDLISREPIIPVVRGNMTHAATLRVRPG